MYRWKFREDMSGHYINGVSSRTFRDAEERLNVLEERTEAAIKMLEGLLKDEGMDKVPAKEAAKVLRLLKGENR